MKKSESKIYSNTGNEQVLGLVPLSSKVVFDIGCGRGDNARLLKRSAKAVYGVTLSEEEAEQAREHCVDVFIHNCENGLPSQLKERVKADVVICSHVLEHIAYPDKLLSDITDVLNDNGLLIVALPNLFHYRSRWELIKGNFNYKESGIWDYTHVRWYTYQSAQRLFRESGFHVSKSFVSGDMPFSSIFRFLPHGMRKSIYNGLAKISPGFFGYQLCYVLKK